MAAYNPKVICVDTPDLSRLKINRAQSGLARHADSRWRRHLLPASLVLVALIAAAGVYYRMTTGTLEVETVTVTMAYPSQSFAVLNATGYVVAQRKAAVASKATGRLEWLGVREGSRVKRGEVLARLENRDVTAAMEQAAANIKLAKANLEQGQSELNEAERNFNRSRDLLAKNFV